MNRFQANLRLVCATLCRASEAFAVPGSLVRTLDFGALRARDPAHG